jgi:hypothetical protein
VLGPIYRHANVVTFVVPAPPLQRVAVLFESQGRDGDLEADPYSATYVLHAVSGEWHRMPSATQCWDVLATQEGRPRHPFHVAWCDDQEIIKRCFADSPLERSLVRVQEIFAEIKVYSRTVE